MNLTEDIYKMTEHFPEHEKFGLISQMRRSSCSVCSNIAEGAVRDSEKVFNQFLNIAQGSLAELHTQLILSKRVGYINGDLLEKSQTKISNIKNGIFRFQERLKSLESWVKTS